VARIEVPMPQMGESIAEGTVSKWLKQVGDTVERDEPILEISTDKVDAEIPAPSAGILVEVVVEEGETVEVGTVVALIDPEGIALIFAVDRILDMMRTVVNVTGDATVATVVAATEGELREVTEKELMS